MSLADLAMVWGPVKVQIEYVLGLSSDAVHVHVSVLMFLFFALVTRRRLSHPMPWLMVLGVECLNELVDMNQPFGTIENNWPASWHDIKNTMFLPTMIMIVVALRDRGFMKPRQRR
ncbi:MAG: hypothetical protein DI547_15270 [Sphingobium sp.]|nr:MAG: hypothetical protein DI547_15270 [Sphingobium sp.]